MIKLPLVLIPSLDKNINYLNIDLINLYVTIRKNRKFFSFERKYTSYLSYYRLSNIIIFNFLKEKLDYNHQQFISTKTFLHTLVLDAIDLIDVSICLKNFTKVDYRKKINF